MPSFRIITFDGGGIRGSLSTRILKNLCIKCPTLLEKTDLFAGTSTGALIALALAYGKDSNYVDNVYNYETIKSIFANPHFNLFRPKYNNKNLKTILNSIFPQNLTLDELKKYVFIPSFNVKGLNSNSWDTVFFNNLSRGSTNSSKVIDVALSSSAAPTYFPSYNNFIDGGVIANNPSMASMISAMKLLKPKYKLSDFKILSIGTGRTLDKIEQNTSSWGALHWIFSPFSTVNTPLVSILLNDTTLADLYCNELLINNYYRINPILKYSIPIDDYKKVPLIKNAVDDLDLTNAINYVQNIYIK